MRKRSSYRPRPIMRDALGWVLQGLKSVTETDGNVDLRIRNMSALESVAKGAATMADVDTLIAVSNMAQALKRLDLGRDWAQELRAGADAIEALRNRGRASGRFLCRGPELQAIRLLMEIHNAQLDASRVGTVERAIDIARKQQAVAV